MHAGQLDHFLCGIYMENYNFYLDKNCSKDCFCVSIQARYFRFLPLLLCYHEKS